MTFINIFKALLVFMWFLGLTLPNWRWLLWSLPAGYAAGIIIGEFVTKKNDKKRKTNNLS